jgi:hypothetical protein
MILPPEPAINGDLNHTLDPTVPLLHDIGWLEDEGPSIAPYFFFPSADRSHAMPT